MPPWLRHLAALVLAILLPGCDALQRLGGSPAGSVQELTEDDTILIKDLLGSPVVELTGSGKRTGRFASYPYGAARFDSSTQTNKYAAVPRDSSVSLDAMGARYYAPDLAAWTSGDPLALTAPERLLTPDFAAANPYVYAKDSPLLNADRDGHFWHIAVGAAVGGLLGGGIEAGRQYFTEGRIHDWGRVGAASTSGAVSGSVMAACPISGLTSFVGVNAASGAAGGVATRLVESGGKSAGSMSQVVFDAGASVALGSFLKGGATLVRAAARRASATARSTLAPSRSSQGTGSSDSVNLASAEDHAHSRRRFERWRAPLAGATGQDPVPTVLVQGENHA